MGDVAGGKGAGLARALGAGLPVLPGFLVTTAATTTIEQHGWGGSAGREVRAAWEELSEGGQTALVVRSSSTAEDLHDSSMAGRFKSVVGVRGWEAFRRAFAEVVESRSQGGEAQAVADAPMAVLVQPLLKPPCSGVMFGIDPVTGRSDRIVVSVTQGGPDKLVSGAVEGVRYELDLDGSEQSHRPGEGGATLNRRQLRRLAALARQADKVFGEPQDLEWALDDDGTLWLLQSRPVTTDVRGVPMGPVLGPGPVSETFPEPLAGLEEDLWVEPLRRGLGEALRLSGSVPAGKVERSPVVVTVGGRVAVDLELFGEVGECKGVASGLDPRPGLRRLCGAWRVGRLRAALPELARDLLERSDDALSAVPPLVELSDRQLLGVLDRCREALVALHGHEVLVGLIVDPGAPRLTGVSVALRLLAHARGEGLADAEIIARYPVVLALVPPHVQASPTLPPPQEPPSPAPVVESEPGESAALLREALRLRARWVQDLAGRAAWTLAEHLVGAELLSDPADVRQMRLEELRALVTDKDASSVQVATAMDQATEPLPARFRLSDLGKPVPVVSPGGDAGTGAGGGVGTGPVHHGDNPPEGSVLVVSTLEPGLAGALPGLAGLVAETGSVLAHVAILAREAGVATVVGFAGARQRFAPGTVVRVDGSTGEVNEVDVNEERA
ncbi:MAG: PEP-utilizing enzyme [Actinomycetota bacterium]|nr:PEP-utilizing enzyme [Actinomycetota bacterium]